VEGLEKEISLEPGKEDQVYRLDDQIHPRDMHEPRPGDDADGSKRK
jgi:hypothetical protein